MPRVRRRAGPGVTAPRASRDAAIVLRLAAWFDAEARDLPWRRPPARRSPGGPRRDPYRALVSEFMLQQTQVSRVIERFGPFLARFPSARALAAASEREVLAAWSGMGYYRRARLLHRAAKEIVARFGGRVPREAEELRSLPGVGRYTAGAIASLVFERPEPIVDGNVQRVLMRLDGIDADPGANDTLDGVWARAAALASRAHRAGVVAAFNEGLMELGAVICTPRSPRCGGCPLASRCLARATGRQGLIPRPKPRPERALRRHDVIVVADSRRGVLVERRPSRGLWANMWQAITIESDGRHAPSSKELAAATGVEALREVERFEAALTHRRILFVVWRGRLKPRGRPIRGEFVPPGAMADLPMSNPQRRVLEQGRLR